MQQNNKFQGVPKVVAWIAKCIGKENEKITTAVDLNCPKTRKSEVKEEHK